MFPVAALREQRRSVPLLPLASLAPATPPSTAPEKSRFALKTNSSLRCAPLVKQVAQRSNGQMYSESGNFA